MWGRDVYLASLLLQESRDVSYLCLYMLVDLCVYFTFLMALIVKKRGHIDLYWKDQRGRFLQ